MLVRKLLLVHSYLQRNQLLRQRARSKGTRAERTEQATHRGGRESRRERAEHGMWSSYDTRWGKGGTGKEAQGKRTMERISMRTNLERSRQRGVDRALCSLENYMSLVIILPVQSTAFISRQIYSMADQIPPSHHHRRLIPSLRHFRSSSILTSWHPNLGNTGLGL